MCDCSTIWNERRACGAPWAQPDFGSRGSQGHDPVGGGGQIFDAGALKVFLEQEGGGARRALDVARVVRDRVSSGQKPDAACGARDVEEHDVARRQFNSKRPLPVRPDLLDPLARDAGADLAKIRVEAEAIEAQTVVTRESVARS